MADVFILGAGFSREVSQSTPLLRDLARIICQKVSLEDTVLSMGNDIEIWLTYLSLSHPWLSEAENLKNRAVYLQLSREVSQVLEQSMQQALAEDCPAWLSSLVRCWHENKASVISLNYDTFVERAATMIETARQKQGASTTLTCANIYPIPITPAAARGGAVIFGERLDSLRLFKLHGSINWYYSGSTSFAFYGETIYYVPVRGWKPGGDIEATHGAFTFDKVPMIIPPAIDKTPYFQHETVRNLWSQAGAALREAERIFCLGYSLPETDLTLRMFFLTNSPKKHVTFYIANTDPNVEEHFKRLLRGADFQFKVLGLGSDPIPGLAEVLARAPETLS